MDNYDLIFSQNSAKKITISDENIATGFDFLGSNPPSRYIFDYLFYRNDSKCKYVNDEVISKYQIKTNIDNMLSYFNTTKNKIDEVSNIKTNIENVKKEHDNDFQSYTTSNNTNVTNIQNINSDISSIMSTITSLKEDITNMISDNSYYNSNEGSVNTKKEQLDTVISNLNAKTQELLSKTDTSNVVIPSYISKNMIVHKGDVLKCTKLPSAYSILCINAGTTDSVNDLPDFLANNINDGYEFTYGTATFRLFLNFLSLPINGKVDYLTGNSMLKIDENGYLINPYNNLRTKRRLIRYSDISASEYGKYNWYITCHKIGSCGINDAYSKQYHKNTDTNNDNYYYCLWIKSLNNTYSICNYIYNNDLMPLHTHTVPPENVTVSTYDSATMDGNSLTSQIHYHLDYSSDLKSRISGNFSGTYDSIPYLSMKIFSYNIHNHQQAPGTSGFYVYHGSSSATEESIQVTTSYQPHNHINNFLYTDNAGVTDNYKWMNLRRSNQLLRSINVFVVAFNSGN